MAEITLERVSKRFPGGVEAVSKLDLTIRDGEVFILVGPSGCGKSTLLNMIVGLEEPTEGVIRVDGKPVTGLGPRERNMAVVFQSYALYPHMTVRENMEFPLRLAKMDRREIERRVGESAEILGLENLLDRRPAALSGGQKQRVAMGRAIVREPAAFLLDEPLSNLDAKLRSQMRTEIARLQRRLGTTMVYVTHDQAEAMTLGDHIAVLREGRLQQVGSPRELYEEPENLFVASFMGSPPMNFLPAEVRRETLFLPMTKLPLPASVRDSLPAGRNTFIAGIRPENLSVAPAGPEEVLPVQGSFRASPELVEWMGAEVFLHFGVQAEESRDLAWTFGRLQDLVPDPESRGSTAGGSRVTVRLDSDREVGEGEILEVRIDPHSLFLFDPETGGRLGP